MEQVDFSRGSRHADLLLDETLCEVMTPSQADRVGALTPLRPEEIERSKLEIARPQLEHRVEKAAGVARDSHLRRPRGSPEIDTDLGTQKRLSLLIAARRRERMPSRAGRGSEASAS